MFSVVTAPVGRTVIVGFATYAVLRGVGRENVYFLGIFAKLRKGTISIVMFVRSSVRPPAWKNSARTGRIFMKFDI
jgi:hypothetical protein